MKSHTILLVDDDDLALRVLERAFSGAGYNTLTASCADQALDVLNSQPVSLVLTDNRMPGMKGVELLGETSRRWPECARILTTAFVDLESTISAINEGSVHRFVSKPWDVEALIQAAHEVLEQQAGRQNQSATLEALRAEQQALYHHAPDGYISFTSDEVITRTNETLLKWTGFSSPEVIGKLHLDELIVTGNRGDYGDFLNRLVEDGRASLEAELVARGGNKTPVQVIARAAFRTPGERVLYHATIRDISHEKQLLAQLIQAQKVESVGRLVGGIAHDFNNLITGILGFSGLSLRQLGPDNPVARNLAEIEKAAQGAAKLVSQLLAYSRRQIGKPVPTDLNQLIRENAGFLTRTLTETVKVNVQLSDEQTTVKADPGQIHQVLLNLCVNARDAMNGTGTLTIETGRARFDEEFIRTHLGSKAGDYAYFSITDTGSGMDEFTKQRIFEPFFTTKEVGKGTGLGLSMVYGIVKSHDGYITVESEPGRGATFRVYLPLCREAVQVAAPQAATTKGGRETILVVEDEPIVLLVAQQVLSDYGYTLLAAANGRDALATFRNRPGEISLVITDMWMPEMTGTDLLCELRRTNPDVRVLLTSGYSVSPDLKKAITEGFPFLQKPYRGDELAKMVREILDSDPVKQPAENQLVEV
ncbi:MAG TPA: response regulator [Blastocatellia bacterium]|nr:response regulator [Blastocatellia bacterium]